MSLLETLIGIVVEFVRPAKREERRRRELADRARADAERLDGVRHMDAITRGRDPRDRGEF